MKRILRILLSLFLVVFLISASAGASDRNNVDTVTVVAGHDAGLLNISIFSEETWLRFNMGFFSSLNRDDGLSKESLRSEGALEGAIVLSPQELKDVSVEIGSSGGGYVREYTFFGVSYGGCDNKTSVRYYDEVGAGKSHYLRFSTAVKTSDYSLLSLGKAFSIGMSWTSAFFSKDEYFLRIHPSLKFKKGDYVFGIGYAWSSEGMPGPENIINGSFVEMSFSLK